LRGEARGWLPTCGAALKFVDSSVTGNDPLAQFVILLIETAKLYHDLVKKVIDLVLIVSFAKFRRLKPLIDYIFGS
jgi:hypothetical protein